jgi:hypothetical protein
MSTGMKTFSFLRAGAVCEKEMEEITKRTTVAQQRGMVFLFIG